MRSVRLAAVAMANASKEIGRGVEMFGQGVDSFRRGVDTFRNGMDDFTSNFRCGVDAFCNGMDDFNRSFRCGVDAVCSGSFRCEVDAFSTFCYMVSGFVLLLSLQALIQHIILLVNTLGCCEATASVYVLLSCVAIVFLIRCVMS